MQRSKYIKQGSSFVVAKEGDIVIMDNLPAGNYVVKQHPITKQFSLDPVPEFKIPTKMYGNIEGRCRRVIQSFQERKAATGIILHGEKGSGKTLLSKLLSETLRVNRGIPTIIVSSPFVGEEFNDFIQSISQEAIVLFDEFEKVYGLEDQPQVLTLLDGTYSSKKLFILTCNNIHRVNENMVNRPGRLYYNFQYNRLEPSEIQDYCNDNLKNTSYVQDIVKLSYAFDSFNFDMIQALVEEMNRFDESPIESIKNINIRTDDSTSSTYIGYYVDENGVKWNIGTHSGDNPLVADSVRFYVNLAGFRDQDGDGSWVILKKSDMTEFNIREGEFTWVTTHMGKPFMVKAIKEKPVLPDFSQFLV